MVEIKLMYVVEIATALRWMRNVPHRVLYPLEADAKDFALRMKTKNNIDYIISRSRFLVDGADCYELPVPEKDASVVEYSFRPRL
jgi:hypothetical protein